MSEMVERVARAISLREAEIMLGADRAQQMVDPRELARAAIEAMRDVDSRTLEVASRNGDLYEHEVYQAWDAVISVILAKVPA